MHSSNQDCLFPNPESHRKCQDLSAPAFSQLSKTALAFSVAFRAHELSVSMAMAYTLMVPCWEILAKEGQLTVLVATSEVGQHHGSTSLAKTCFLKRPATLDSTSSGSQQRFQSQSHIACADCCSYMRLHVELGLVRVLGTARIKFKAATVTCILLKESLSNCRLCSECPRGVVSPAHISSTSME